MNEETYPNEVCITSYYNGEISGIDIIPLDGLESVAIPPNVYVTVYATPLTRH